MFGANDVTSLMFLGYFVEVLSSLSEKKIRILFCNIFSFLNAPDAFIKGVLDVTLHLILLFAQYLYDVDLIFVISSISLIIRAKIAFR